MAGASPRLLALPLELRELIYREALLQPSRGTELLRVCREVYSDAHKLLFQRPLLVRSQPALHQWLEQAPQDLLQHVTEAILDLQDVDLRPLLSPIVSPTTEPDSVPRLRVWELYESELEQLSQALGKLRNVKTFTLRALPGRQSHLYREFLMKVLGLLGTLFPGLQDLSLQGNLHHQSLAFLRSLQELRALSFDGFSASSSSETAEILSSLQLTSISLVCQHTMLTPSHHQHSTFTSKPQCFTGDVLRTISQLASFSVTESIAAPSPALFFTSEILSSLHSHKTLAGLSISLSHTPEPETFEALEEFLDKSSSIGRLELDWPDLDPNILEAYLLLPNSLKSFWIRTKNMAAAFDALWTILEHREAGNAPQLSRVVLIRKKWNADGIGENIGGGYSAPTGSAHTGGRGQVGIEVGVTLF